MVYGNPTYRKLKHVLHLAAAIIGFSGALYAQNLVSNPSFKNSEVTSTVHYPS